MRDDRESENDDLKGVLSKRLVLTITEKLNIKIKANQNLKTEGWQIPTGKNLLFSVNIKNWGTKSSDS